MVSCHALGNHRPRYVHMHMHVRVAQHAGMVSRHALGKHRKALGVHREAWVLGYEVINQALDRVLLGRCDETVP